MTAECTVYHLSKVIIFLAMKPERALWNRIFHNHSGTQTDIPVNNSERGSSEFCFIFRDAAGPVFGIIVDRYCN